MRQYLICNLNFPSNSFKFFKFKIFLSFALFLIFKTFLSILSKFLIVKFVSFKVVEVLYFLIVFIVCSLSIWVMVKGIIRLVVYVIEVIILFLGFKPSFVIIWILSIILSRPWNVFYIVPHDFILRYLFVLYGPLNVSFLTIYLFYLLAIFFHFWNFSYFSPIRGSIFVYRKTTHPLFALLLLPSPIIIQWIRNELVLVHLKFLQLLPWHYFWLRIIAILQLRILHHHLLDWVYLIILLKIPLKSYLMWISWLLWFFRTLLVLFVVNLKLLLVIFLYWLS